MTATSPADPSERYEIALDVRDPGWEAAVADLGTAVAGAARAALAAADPGPAECAIVLADDAFVQALNRTYRGLDRPTNVLSFENAAEPWAPEGAPRLLGDVVVALQTTLREAAEQEITPRAHLCHLIVHGMLHLLGYDHDSDDRAAAMERLEVDVLARLGIDDPYRADPCNGTDDERTSIQ